MQKKKIVKQVVGIDVAQKELVVGVGRMYEDLCPEVFANKTFPNHEKGFIALLTWVKKMMSQEVPIRFVMEATGVYHELFAYFLDAKGWEVSIVLPNKISNYFRTLTINTLTDKSASVAITLFGLERKLDRWVRPQKQYRDMRQLTRERDQIVAERTIVKNQLHAEQVEAFPNEASLNRIKERIRLLNKQEKQIKEEISALVASNESVQQTVKRISSIPGVGELTAVTVLGETNGFELIRNKKQLASYAGLDIKEKQSGTSVRGKARLSKKGNKYLRKAMHFPALSAIRNEDRFKAVFARLIAKHGIKMKAVAAVQRKLLELMYTLYKNKTMYDRNYMKSTSMTMDKVA